MRLAVCALSAVLLSGCSWLGGFGQSGNHYKAPNGSAHYAGPYGGKAHNPCQIYSPAQPIPPGCDPASVTLATTGSQYGGFPQQPNFEGGYASSGYGSHAASAGNNTAGPRAKRMRKPKLRGHLSLGLEKSISGSLLDYAKVPGIDPELTYNPDDYAEGSTTGSVATGNITQVTYTGAVEKIHKPTISFDDVYSTPTRISGGVEYIVSPKATLFANAGYTHAQGEEGETIEVEATLLRQTVSQDYDTDTGAAVGGPVSNTSFIPNATIAQYAYNFSDMERYDLEVGGRYYLDPIVKDQAHRTLTPFVGASAGMSHYNAQSFGISQRQVFYQRAFDSNLATQDFYNVPQPTTTVALYDSQWVPSGALTAGMEWQVTPKAALALESGVKFEGTRDYANGAKGEKNIAVPLTLRGSFNF